MHPLPDSWTFNGDFELPTFQPSFRQTFHRNDVDAPGATVECHYIITDGKIQFCPDSWHRRSDIVQMPLIPDWISDFGQETQD